MLRYSCGCALGWKYGEGQCATGVVLYAQVQAALRAYQEAKYYYTVEPAKRALDDLEKQFAEHFGGLTRDTA
jgi:hypothetical protein